MNKTVIAPVIAVACLAVDSIFHTQIPPDLQDSIATVAVLGVSVIVSIWGIFKNHGQGGNQ